MVPPPTEQTAVLSAAQRPTCSPTSAADAGRTTGIGPTPSMVIESEITRLLVVADCVLPLAGQISPVTLQHPLEHGVEHVFELLGRRERSHFQPGAAVGTVGVYVERRNC